MAKLSARGAHKVAQGTREYRTPEDTALVRVRVALRSDGKVLRAIDVKHDDRPYWSRGGYSIIGALPADDRSSAERFANYCEQRGFAHKVA